MAACARVSAAFFSVTSSCSRAMVACATGQIQMSSHVVR